jgi:hypothetical protein
MNVAAVTLLATVVALAPQAPTYRAASRPSPEELRAWLCAIDSTPDWQNAVRSLKGIKVMNQKKLELESGGVVHRASFETPYLIGEASWAGDSGGGHVWVKRFDAQNVAEAEANGDNTATPLFESVDDARSFLSLLGANTPTQLDREIIKAAGLDLRFSEGLTDFDLVAPTDGAMVGSYSRPPLSRFDTAIGRGAPRLQVDNLVAVNVREHRLVARFNAHRRTDGGPRNRVPLCR